MRIVQSAAELGSARPDELTLTIGNFDGLHLGHRAVIAELITSASARGAVSVAVTFEPHPLRALKPACVPELLSPGSEKSDLLAGTGLDVLMMIDFTTETSILSAESFLASLGVGRGTHLVLGYNFKMGRERSCNLARLSELGAEIGYGLDVVPPVEHRGEPISSSRVRAALIDGDLEGAEAMLGRSYRLEGPIVGGERVGRSLSCPTANLSVPESKLLPADGVYLVTVDSHDDHPGVLYVGSRPTFGEGEKRVEVHLLDLELDLYGQTLVVSLRQRLRDDRRFEDAGGLAAQIEQDLDLARKLLPQGNRRGNAAKT